MRRFNPHKYYKALNETPLPIIQPTTLGFEAITRYLHQKYKSNIVRDNVRFYWLPEVKENIHLLNQQIAKARKTTGDYRFSWHPGTTHAVSFFYIREGGEEALFYTDSNRNEKNIIPNFAQELSKLTGLPVYSTQGNRQADLRSCYTDALVFARDITGVSPQTGEYVIPKFLAKIKQRAQKVGSSSFVTLLPDELLKTAQISSFLTNHKEAEDRIISQGKTLTQFRDRYSKKATVKGQEKTVASYLVEKGYKYSKIIQIQFYLDQMPYLTDEQRNSFIKEAKRLLKADPSLNLYAFAVQQAGLYENEVNENQFFKAAMTECTDSTVIHTVVRDSTFSHMCSFYSLIPSEYHFRVLTYEDPQKGNTVLHWAVSSSEKFKYLLGSLPKEQWMDALTMQGENNNTVVHWLASKQDLFSFALQGMPGAHRFQALTAPGENSNTALHWLEKNPEGLRCALESLPGNDRLAALLVSGQRGETPLFWISGHPESMSVVLDCLPQECAHIVRSNIVSSDVRINISAIHNWLKEKSRGTSLLQEENKVVTHKKTVSDTPTKDKSALKADLVSEFTKALEILSELDTKLKNKYQELPDKKYIIDINGKLHTDLKAALELYQQSNDDTTEGISALKRAYQDALTEDVKTQYNTHRDNDWKQFFGAVAQCFGDLWARLCFKYEERSTLRASGHIFYQVQGGRLTSSANELNRCRLAIDEALNKLDPPELQLSSVAPNNDSRAT